MCGDIPPLPNTPSWRGAQFKKVQGQPYTFYNHYLIQVCANSATVLHQIFHIPTGNGSLFSGDKGKGKVVPVLN